MSSVTNESRWTTICRWITICWQRFVRFIRQLAFASGWDFLKAGVLAGLFFLWGNFLGLFYEPPRSLTVELNCLGECIEGFGSISVAFDDFEADTEYKVPLSFDPLGLRQLNVCEELRWPDTGRGMDYLRRIVAEYSQCIMLEVETVQGIGQAKISKAKNHTQLRSVKINDADHWFCGCEENVLNAYESDPGDW